MSIHPIGGSDLVGEGRVPACIIQAFNELIKQNFNGTHAVVLDAALISYLKVHNPYIRTEGVEYAGWLETLVRLYNNRSLSVLWYPKGSTIGLYQRMYADGYLVIPENV